MYTYNIYIYIYIYVHILVQHSRSSSAKVVAGKVGFETQWSSAVARLNQMAVQTMCLLECRATPPLANVVCSLQTAA